MGACNCLAEKEKHDVTIESNRRWTEKGAEQDLKPEASWDTKDHVIDFSPEVNIAPLQSAMKGYLLRKVTKQKKKPLPKVKVIPAETRSTASEVKAPVLIEAEDPEIDEILVVSTPMMVEDSTADYIGNPDDVLSANVRKVLHELPHFDYSRNVKNVTQRGAVRLIDGSVYVGEWYKNARFGKGKLFSVDGSFQEGYWKNGQLHYKGRVIYSTGDYYEGQLKNGVREGRGLLVSVETKSSYEGEWSEDRQHGEGTERFSENGSTYNGHFEKGVKQGNGKFEWADGSQYEGEFQNNMLEGQGRYKWADQREYVGEWKQNKMHGRGKFLWPDGRVYEGEYNMDKKEGYGVYQWENGKVYEGSWVDGKMHGVGFLTVPGKARKKYSFSNGKKGDAIDDSN